MGLNLKVQYSSFPRLAYLRVTLACRICHEEMRKAEKWFSVLVDSGSAAARMVGVILIRVISRTKFVWVTISRLAAISNRQPPTSLVSTAPSLQVPSSRPIFEPSSIAFFWGAFTLDAWTWSTDNLQGRLLRSRDSDDIDTDIDYS